VNFIAAGHTPHQSGLHQADLSMDAAVCGAGMCARAAFACHLSPIRPGWIAAVYWISPYRIMIVSSTKQSLVHITREVRGLSDCTMVSVNTLVSRSELLRDLPSART